MHFRMRLMLVGIVILIVAVVAAAACGDDDDSGSSAQLDELQSTLDGLLVNTQRSQVLATMTAIRAEALHDLDDTIQGAPEVEAGWRATFTRIRQAVTGTDWPESLTEGSAELEARLSEAEEALGDEDLSAAKTASGEAHAAWHNLEHDAYAFVAGEEHSGDDGHGDEDGHDDEGDDHGDEGDSHDDGENGHRDEGDSHDDGDMSHSNGMTHESIELTDADLIPTVDVVVHADAREGWNIEIVTTDWRWAPEHTSSAHVPGEGHAHIYVDGVKLGRVYGDWYHLASMEPGQHEVRVTLNANDHSDLMYNGAIIADAETVQVEA